VDIAARIVSSERMRRRGAGRAVAAARATALGLWLLGTCALAAGRVVVFDFPGDGQGRVRAQVIHALVRDHKVTLVPLATWKSAAGRLGLRGPGAFTPSAVGQLAPALNVELVVAGAVASSFYVRFLDATGQELWSHELGLSRGRVSPKNAARLARAVAAGVRQAKRPKPSSQAPIPPAPEEKVAGPVEPAPDRPIGHPDPRLTPPVAPAPSSPNPPRIDRSHPVSASASAPAPPPAESPPAIPRLRLELMATASLRSNCAGPGSDGCGAQASADPGGPSVDFSPSVPYAGLEVRAALFPLAELPGAARGIGLTGAYHHGFDRVRARQAGSAAQTEAKASEGGYRLEGAWRWFFSRSGSLWGHVGAGAGYAAEDFSTDASLSGLLLDERHSGPIVTVDGAFPIRPWLAAELSASLLPWLSPGVDQTVAFGQRGRGLGFELEGGMSGLIRGPLGYVLHLRYTRLTETFEGQGARWISGGQSLSSYLVLEAGLSVQL
jgi:hypothetical protein